MEKYYLTWKEVYDWCDKVYDFYQPTIREPLKIFGIPRGGLCLAGVLCSYLPFCDLVVDIEEADLILDDIVDSGRTKKKYQKVNKIAAFEALVDKKKNKKWKDSGWIVFPWENDKKDDFDDNLIRILEFFGKKTDKKSIMLLKNKLHEIFN